MSNNIGKNGYNWWVGVVENIDDPLKNGRCKVRIFGWHTEDLMKLPTNDLPWATLMTGPNSGGDFSVPIPGDYVSGYFTDGENAQNPYIVSILPGIPAEAPDTSKGFSPQPLIPGQPAEPNKPVTPEGVVGPQIGKPTNPLISQGIVKGTGISITNSQLAHVCDFRYALNFDIGLSVLINPVSSIQNAIKTGKNNAAMFIGMLIGKLNDQIRSAIKAIIAALGFDPTGQLSTIYATLKFKLQDINDYIEKIAKYVEIASMVVYLIKDIQEILTYLKNLPARYQAIVKDCIATFTNGAKTFATQVAAIPGQVGATVDGLAKELQSSADSVLSGLNAEVAGITVPSALQNVFGTPSTDHGDLITTYISTSYANTETTLAQTNADTFDPTKMKWA